MTQDKGSIFSSEGIRRLLEGGAQNLTDDERALLLALIGAEEETGRQLTAEEREAFNRLREQLGSYDADELAQAVKHMVTAQTQAARKTEWPELQRRRHQEVGAQ